MSSCAECYRDSPMSYDYFLFAAPADGSDPSIDAIAANPVAIGTPDALIAHISARFPALRWSPPDGAINAWFGVGGPEFIVQPESDGRVIALKAAYIERHEVRALASALGLVVFDPQRGVFVTD